MRGALLPASLLLAALATLGITLLVLRDRPLPVAEEAAPLPAAVPAGRPAEPELRRYETTATLVEDLRDALADGDAALLESECWRVSDRLRGRTAWTLTNLARPEPSPGVRALLVFATGVHEPDSRAVLDFLRDRAAIVRRAAALALGWSTDGMVELELVGMLRVKVGRRLPDASRATLVQRRDVEADADTRRAMTSVLEAGA